MIVLFTDFGLNGPYVGQVKAAFFRLKLMSDRKRLLSLFGELNIANQVTLLALAEFLHARQDAKVLTVQRIERPLVETVMGALKRLTATYPMLDKAILLDEASRLSSQHVLQGRAAPAVIDELEALFLRYYEHYKTANV